MTQDPASSAPQGPTRGGVLRRGGKAGVGALKASLPYLGWGLSGILVGLGLAFWEYTGHFRKLGQVEAETLPLESEVKSLQGFYKRAESAQAVGEDYRRRISAENLLGLEPRTAGLARVLRVLEAHAGAFGGIEARGETLQITLTRRPAGSGPLIAALKGVEGVVAVQEDAREGGDPRLVVRFGDGGGKRP